ncbi:hypothetical protein AVEN_226224-1 [Araneus ventricosus]|uniref:Uncharacterized protein n=1 Tax=Araneus ventricosus TaxID=182803 RepID=A0A4Y2J5E5_ARAVE|nr:hypothetical protein AVEN_226224-1 [Araneus ventricosus]
MQIVYGKYLVFGAEWSDLAFAIKLQSYNILSLKSKVPHNEFRLCPERVVECDFEGFEKVPVKPVVNAIVYLAKIMGMEKDSNDIDELKAEHSQELIVEELGRLHC